MSCHESSRTARFSGAFPSKTFNFAIAVNLVVLKNRELSLLALMFDFLWCSVDLLLSLFGSTAKSKDEVESRLFLNVVIRQGSTVFKLLASKNKSLLIWRNA